MACVLQAAARPELYSPKALYCVIPNFGNVTHTPLIERRPHALDRALMPTELC